MNYPELVQELKKYFGLLQIYLNNLIYRTYGLVKEKCFTLKKLRKYNRKPRVYLQTVLKAMRFVEVESCELRNLRFDAK